MSYIGFTSAGLDPLDPTRALQPWQRIVRGPANTGPRVTVVDLRDPGTWFPWISRDSAGNPIDAGTVVGGTWDGSGAQPLPDLTTMGAAGQPWWVWAVGLAVVYLLFFGNRKTRSNW